MYVCMNTKVDAEDTDIMSGSSSSSRSCSLRQEADLDLDSCCCCCKVRAALAELLLSAEPS